LSPSVRIFVCTKPVDMRKSFSGLFGLVQNHIKQDPFLCGELEYVSPTAST
jgi:IS66 Orf2 like protein